MRKRNFIVSPAQIWSDSILKIKFVYGIFNRNFIWSSTVVLFNKLRTIFFTIPQITKNAYKAKKILYYQALVSFYYFASASRSFCNHLRSIRPYWKRLFRRLPQLSKFCIKIKITNFFIHLNIYSVKPDFIKFSVL